MQSPSTSATSWQNNSSNVLLLDHLQDEHLRLCRHCIYIIVILSLLSVVVYCGLFFHNYLFVVHLCHENLLLLLNDAEMTLANVIVINPRRGAARVTVVLSVTTFSATTHNKAAKKRYQRVQYHTGLI